MQHLEELARRHTGLDDSQIAHLQHLIDEWRVLADFSFADLLLFAPLKSLTPDPWRFVVLHQVRPNTGQTLYPNDMVGEVVDESERPLVARAWREHTLYNADVEGLHTEELVQRSCIPVGFAGKTLAVVTRDAPRKAVRRSGDLEQMYMDVFVRLSAMISEGVFPFKQVSKVPDPPSVGDGVLVLDDQARVVYASPNAVTSLHRMGIFANMVGARLGQIGFDDTAVLGAMTMGAPVSQEVESSGAGLVYQAIPLIAKGKVERVAILLRDVTDLRRRDRMLLTKDATIREIHHRVKNNLQTIASLLRIQARRIDDPQARAALAESETRVRAIAVVHESLSTGFVEDVPFREIVRPLVRIAEDTMNARGWQAQIEVCGDAGVLPSDIATTLAMVVNELMQNALDHAFDHQEEELRGPAKIVVRLSREADFVGVAVSDNGAGLPEDFEPSSSGGLGMSIVSSLVSAELGGSLRAWNDEGAHFAVTVPLESTIAVSSLDSTGGADS
ncbi:MAG: sensor histidine kinase [Acidimicrobiia bacterium]|jgi:two-component sensor histidine kinase|nr:sensor histidine kinase [Acidimicrobiia bacterium]MBP8181439.1 sensor histidine kinase [Acidimicrobiia bacterium]